ncbi:Aste57867_5844 [Aphanomyces stellatus]|uniref:HECT-type E3 ubiquitin transferase n=1 Tax=Aphanomyces stellatus TaxID=120398 RepID=A0A485KF32_9STRA|nr:hypothetical protein As57867_005830 [Aphanomyces stellatus]VFT82867.1 Aste57867_5844 [Aphanomyces stellatus]
MELPWLILIISFSTLIVGVAFANWIYMKYYHVPVDDTSSPAMLYQNFLAYMPGLKRQDIEELSVPSDRTPPLIAIRRHLEAERWQCGVCDFHNLTTKPLCSLCSTKRDCRFLEVYSVPPPKPTLSRTSSKESKPALSRTNSKDYIQLLSTRASRQGSRLISLAFENILLPEDLNAHQRSARMRKQWIRRADVHGNTHWHRRYCETSHVTEAYLIQLHPPSSACEKMPSTVVTLDDGLSPVLESPRTTHQSTIDSYAIKSPHAGVAASSSWRPLDAVAPNTTVLGTTVSVATAASLHKIARMPFSFKYAWFLHQTTDLVVPYDELHIKIKVSRGVVIEEAVENLLHFPDRALCAIIRYEFVGESAQDAGAVQREWYMLVAEGLLDAANGLFVVLNRDDHSYFINPNSAHAWTHPVGIDHVRAYRAVGRFIGRSLLDGQVIPMQLSPVLLKAILGVPLSLDDVESLDRTLYKGLQYLLDHDNAHDLMLTFSATEMQGTAMVEVDLVPNGHLRPVTDANKHEYARRLVHYLLFGRVEEQMLALIQGVYDIVPPELLMPFDHKEFELVLCGLSEVDVADWQANTVTSSNLKESEQLQWFWEVVDSMNANDRSKLLQYATGSSRVPVQGFKGLTSYDGAICLFTLKGIPYACGLYPATHACYNRIDLPLYPTKAMMHEALTMLLLSDPTGFTII